MDSELVEKIEAKRSELEANLAKLRKSLHHWTSLELDYESLKDEFRGLGQNATKNDCLEVARESGIQTVDEKELSELIEPSRGKVRSPVQLVEVLSKRVEYVLRNTETLKKQISELEKKRNAVLLASHPEHEAKAALPLSEITEELDDDDNVLSSTVQQQGDTAKKVLEVLDKTDKNSTEGTLPPKGSSDSANSRIVELESSDDDADSEKSDSALPKGSLNVRQPQKSVEGPDSRASKEYSINPDDTEEEARLRQEMIQYGLGEVGNIVAELEMANLEEGEFEDEDEEMTDETDDNTEDEYDEDSEDETGRSTSKSHTDKYRSHIEELQKQLGLQLENVGPDPSEPPNPGVKDQINYLRDSEFNEHIEHLPPEFKKRFGRLSPAEAARKAAIAREKSLRSAQKSRVDDDVSEPKKEDDKKNKKKKKQVAFAADLDVAPDTPDPSISAVRDTIFEHTGAKDGTPTPLKSTKVSRFKADRSSQPSTSLFPPPMDNIQKQRDVKTGPLGSIIASNLVERPGTTLAGDAHPPDGDDFDEELQRRQIALEHHRLRNKMVHDQGGYVKGGEAENWGDAYSAPEMQDEKTGQPIKISRFKAARMRP